ncbi:hypothetical protein FNAPI_10262 [Fusarium napiforme]|uniref:Uncharacterized protein n=1 Tax=Fusarium napiforme TaxID=42672 RepID=A0A8H5MT22_9HYPO|nr:hypothetical protein FNAPI_10262 [Fusarium napiforme]
MAAGRSRRPSDVSADEEDATQGQTGEPDPAPAEKTRKKDYTGRLIDKSLNAAKGIIIIAIIKGKRQKLPQPELFMVLEGFAKYIPKIEGTQRQVHVREANLRRAER